MKEDKEKSTECGQDSTCSACDKGSECDAATREKHAEELLKQRLDAISKKVMVMSGKGGVGKSTVAANLAVALARKGCEVGLLDADIHGPNIPKLLGLEDSRLHSSPEGILPVRPMERLKVVSVAYILDSPDTPVIWRGPMKHGVIRQFLGEVVWGNLDILIVDLPPGTGDEPLSVAQSVGDADGSIIVTTPQDVALLDSRKSIAFSQKIGVPVLGVVENMSGLVCPHCGKTIDMFIPGGGEAAAHEMGVAFLGCIPMDPVIMQGGDAGTPFMGMEDAGGTVAAFEKIVKRIEKNLEAVDPKRYGLGGD
ncbi:MAG: Mrp/NBP35 family ATP-binding protein [Deltaproteobacteria bacterium]|nr:Mrp/NBP35 family ATP-binding protein [Candidatus Zymogenaceae bacterium]